ncbi:MAG: metallophosphoesterase [Lachnospiraceae bacterium]|nr:metallophosphoesterase [Lachnospiraceae bacterium]
MKILVVADKEEKALWDFYDPKRTEGIDLILSCGDLDAAYLEFLVTMTNCPLYYVRGNHDESYSRRPPEGCTDIDGKVVNVEGLRILGLGGSMRYRPGDTMYTEEEMKARVRKAGPRIAMMNGVDIVVAHAPVKGYGDLEDLPHQGFDCFRDLLDRYAPKYLFHGHVHQEYGGFQRERTYPSGTRLINACGSYLIEIGENEYPEKGKTGSTLYDLYTMLNVKIGRKY